ncbi:uncharacterized protein STEHIDRAFT_164861, partial [Stereum hirsutum FP-91666 SS1]|uniref:uncharacterized protein n=1 Tax=Stereum hirsutum (strain FP-91666) TaxID=721885 RepID=UPI000440D10F
MSRKSAFNTCPQPTLPVLLTIEFVEILCQTIFYGIFLVIVPVCVHTFFKHGLKVRSSVIMVSITMFTFSISTVHWCITVMMITSLISSSNVSRDTGSRQVLNAIALINYCFADGVLVWRMRVLCSSWFSWRHLIIPVTTLIMTFLSVITTISIQILMISTYRNANAAETITLNKAIDASQTATMVFSLITNAIATFLVGRWAWEYRKSIRATLSMTVKASRSTPVERVLALLAESGLIYIFSSIFVLASSFIRVSCGTVGDVYVPIHSQIAGMYP